MTLGGCATKYMLPTNRFITPETQGGFIRGQLELQKTMGKNAKIDTSNNTVDEGVVYEDIDLTGYAMAFSFAEAFDLMWNHVGNSVSLVGGKYQFLGGSRASKATDHKLAAVFLFGANKHTTDDESAKFRLAGQEIAVIYGYRFAPFVMPYVSLDRSTYSFDGTLYSSNANLNGASPSFKTTILSLNMGSEFNLDSFYLKLEYTYQMITTSDTKKINASTFGAAFGVTW